MTIRVGINGFGRIGRNFWRAANAADGDRGIEIVAANDLGDIATMAHLLKYDTVLGTLAEDVSVSGDTIRVGDKSIKILAEREPAKLPWRDLGVDVVPVERAIGGEGGDRTADLVEQGTDLEPSSTSFGV